MENPDCKSEFLEHESICGTQKGAGKNLDSEPGSSQPAMMLAGVGSGLEKEEREKKLPFLASGLTYKTSRGVDSPRDVPFCPMLPDLTALCRSTFCISCRCRTGRDRSGRSWERPGEPASASPRSPPPLPPPPAASLRASCQAAAAAA